MVDFVNWPAALKPIDATIPYLVDSFSTPGPSLNGAVRGVESLAARWAYGFRFKVWTRDEHLAFRSLMSRNRGMSRLIRFKICDARYAPKLLVNGNEVSPPSGLVRHSDNTTFGDGTQYAMDHTASVADTDTAAGATQIDVVTNNPLAIKSGHYFSTGYNFYTVDSVTNLAGNRKRINFYPRLRADITGPAPISFKEIYCLMRITSQDSLNIEAAVLKHGMGNLSLEEALI